MDIDEIYAEDVDWHDTARTMQLEITRLRAEVDRRDREQAYYADQLMAVTTGLTPLCACESCECARSGYCTDGGPCREDGRDQACPIHGDGKTFVTEVLALRQVEQRATYWATRPIIAADAHTVVADILDAGGPR